MVSFGKRKVGNGAPCFITFEAGPTHSGLDSAKLLVNCLLPIGSCLSLIYTDFLYHNWILNVLVVLLIITAAFLRGVIAQKDNKLKSI